MRITLFNSPGDKSELVSRLTRDLVESNTEKINNILNDFGVGEGVSEPEGTFTGDPDVLTGMREIVSPPVVEDVFICTETSIISGYMMLRAFEQLSLPGQPPTWNVHWELQTEGIFFAECAEKPRGWKPLGDSSDFVPLLDPSMRDATKTKDPASGKTTIEVTQFFNWVVERECNKTCEIPGGQMHSFELYEQRTELGVRNWCGLPMNVESGWRWDLSGVQTNYDFLGDDPSMVSNLTVSAYTEGPVKNLRTGVTLFEMITPFCAGGIPDNAILNMLVNRLVEVGAESRFKNDLKTLFKNKLKFASPAFPSIPPNCNTCNPGPCCFDI